MAVRGPVDHGAISQTLAVIRAALSYCCWNTFEQEWLNLATFQGNK